MPDVIERRKDPRFALIVPAKITESKSGRSLATRTSDVSKTGCYVDTLTPFLKGTTVHVQLTRGEETFETQGIVMYVSPNLGMGIQFEEPIPSKKVETLARWLENAARLRP
jgi:hypothetical protein